MYIIIINEELDIFFKSVYFRLKYDSQVTVMHREKWELGLNII